MTKEKVEAVASEKSLDQVKLEGIVERLRNFLKDENIGIFPKLVFDKTGIFPDLEIRMLEDKVRNVYDEQKSDEPSKS